MPLARSPGPLESLNTVTMVLRLPELVLTVAFTLMFFITSALWTRFSSMQTLYLLICKFLQIAKVVVIRSHRCKVSVMKTIVLAGGKGTRMESITGGGNKHLLPLWDSTVIQQTTRDLERDWCIVTSPRDADVFSQLIPDVPIYQQYEPTGIADAILSAKPFAYREPIAVLLGDNLFSNKIIPSSVSQGAKLTLANGYSQLNRFGVASLDESGNIFSVLEKPKESQLPKSAKEHKVIAGFYVFDATVWDRLYDVGLSERNEKEIIPVLQSYLEEGTLFAGNKFGGNWTDIGVSPKSYEALVGVPENWSRGNSED